MYSVPGAGPILMQVRSWLEARGTDYYVTDAGMVIVESARLAHMNGLLIWQALEDENLISAIGELPLFVPEPYRPELEEAVDVAGGLRFSAGGAAAVEVSVAFDDPLDLTPRLLVNIMRRLEEAAVEVRAAWMTQVDGWRAVSFVSDEEVASVTPRSDPWVFDVKWFYTARGEIVVEADSEGEAIEAAMDSGRFELDEEFSISVEEWPGPVYEFFMGGLWCTEEVGEALEVRQYVAGNPSTPEDVLLTLSHDPARPVRSAAARTLAGEPTLQRWHPKPPDPDPDSRRTANRRFAAERSDGSDGVLERLAADPAVSVRAAVAGNDSTPTSILESLSRDEKSQVRTAIAANQSTPLAVLQQLAEDRHPRVRGGVGRNAAIPWDLAERLSRDPDRRALEGLMRNPEWSHRMADFVTDRRAALRLALAENRGIFPHVASELAGDHDNRVLRALAANPSTPLEVLDRLALEGASSVLGTLAARLDANESFLREMAGVHAPDVQFEVARNPRTPPDALRRLLKHLSDWETKKRLAIDSATRPEVLRALAATGTED